LSLRVDLLSPPSLLTQPPLCLLSRPCYGRAPYSCASPTGARPALGAGLGATAATLRSLASCPADGTPHTITVVLQAIGADRGATAAIRRFTRGSLTAAGSNAAPQAGGPGEREISGAHTLCQLFPVRLDAPGQRSPYPASDRARAQGSRPSSTTPCNG
jgi:hypothetical protein